MTKSELNFIDQLARKLLVELATAHITTGLKPSDLKPVPEIILSHMITKGWLSKKRDRLLARGFSTAAAFLKR